MKHTWEQRPFNPDDPRTILYICKHCGYFMKMNYILPDDVLQTVGVPDCDEYLLRTVMNE